MIDKMKPIVIITIAFVLLSGTIIPVMGQAYTQEQVESEFQSEDKPELVVTTRTSCGEGTIEMNGECVLDTNYKSPSQPSSREGTGKVSVFQKIIDFMDEPFLSMEKAVGGDGHKRPHKVSQVESQKDVVKIPYCWNIINFKVCIFS